MTIAITPDRESGDSLAQTLATTHLSAVSHDRARSHGKAVVTFQASGSLEHADEWINARVSIPTAEATALLAFIHLDRTIFGACDALDFAARLRRGLWPSRRASEEIDGYLRELLDLAQRARDGLVLYMEDVEPPLS